MNKKYFIVGLVVLLFVFACCIFSGQYIRKGCFLWECAPERDFHVLDLEIPISLFPEGAFTDHLTYPTDNLVGEIEAGNQDIHIGYETVLYRIYRFPSTRKATADFNRIKNSMVDPETGLAWKPPDKQTFTSLTADEIYVACGYWSEIYRCKMTARYQEYVVFLNADINEKITYSNFEKIVAYVDEQISSHLYP